VFLAYADRSVLISPSRYRYDGQTRGFQMRARALLLAFLVGAALSLTAVQANAASTVYIYKVYFDSQAPTPGATPALTRSMW
jgi:hypothetical protein